MYATLPTVDGRHVRALTWSNDEEVRISQSRPMARNYRAIDPYDVLNKFRAEGFEAEVKRMGRILKHATSGNGWQHTVTARHPDIVTEGYQDGVRIVLGHDGRTPLVIMPESVRLFCMNQFRTAPACIRHTDRRIDEFIADPVGFSMRAIGESRTIAGRLEALHGKGDHRVLLNRVTASLPRLGARAWNMWEKFYRQDRDAWGALQALTNTHTERLVRLTARATEGEGIEAAASGWYPAAWDALLGPPVALTN